MPRRTWICSVVIFVILAESIACSTSNKLRQDGLPLPEGSVGPEPSPAASPADECASTPGADQLDHEFGGCGRVFPRGASGGFQFGGASILGTTSLLVAGWSSHWAAVVLSSNGSWLEASALSGALGGQVHDVVSFDDHSVDVVGWEAGTADVFQLREGGTPDKGFGDNAHGRLVDPSGALFPYAATRLSDGALLLAGDGYSGEAGYLFLGKLTKDGVPDSSFGNDGVLRIGESASGVDDTAIGVSSAASGDEFETLEVVGSGGRLVRRQRDGSERWVLPLPDVPLTGAAPRVLVDPYDRSIVAFFSSSKSSAEVARLMPDGSYDPSFGTDGRKLLSLPPESWTCDIALDEASRILLAVQLPGGEAFEVYRLSPAGLPDPSFGIAGAVRIEHGPIGAQCVRMVLAEGQIYLVGQAGSPVGGFVERLRK